MNIDFEWYKVFYYAARELSFTKAAEHLHITQSAVSQAVKNLENSLGVPLFVRRPRKLVLTHEGKELYHYVTQGYRFLKLGEKKIEEMQNISAGEITIGVSDTICKYFLTGHIQKFLVQYPAIKIKIINRTTPGITALLKEGTIDFGIVSLPLADPALDIIDFIEVEDIFVASKKCSILENRLCTLKELAGYPLLLLHKASRTRQNLDAFFDSLKVVISSAIEFESMELLVEFARIGAGIAHVLKESASEYLKKGNLFHIKTKEQLPRRKLGIAVIKGGAVSAATERFLLELGNKN
ncbi:MAG: LysR family transcriptional regulator [Spirochaetales bacterium]|nr:LysR family transcriptional regulator [Spirochaetales bacterium]